MNAQAAKAAVLAAPGGHVMYTKEQAVQMLTEVEIGQRARRALSNLKTLAAAAANAAGAAA